MEQHSTFSISAYPIFAEYLHRCDQLFPYHPELWLTSSGFVPTYSWFVSRLQHTLGPDVGGHSIRSGGATALALAGVPDNIIQLLGRWSSDTVRIYIRLHPVLLHALLHSDPQLQHHLGP